MDYRRRWRVIDELDGGGVKGKFIVFSISSSLALRGICQLT